ncbi:hypothetical protein WJX77_012450 [Trebouxia sp. C0004]
MFGKLRKPCVVNIQEARVLAGTQQNPLSVILAALEEDSTGYQRGEDAFGPFTELILPYWGSLTWAQYQKVALSWKEIKVNEDNDIAPPLIQRSLFQRQDEYQSTLFMADGSPAG